MLQIRDQHIFIQNLLTDQPHVPKYFSYNVTLNKNGAPLLQAGRFRITEQPAPVLADNQTLLIDTRPGDVFKMGHAKGAINIPLQGSFETWLGTIVAPYESFFVILEDESKLVEVIQKTAKIGYDTNIRGLLLNPPFARETCWKIEAADVAKNPIAFTILDVRNYAEVKSGKLFESSLHIPLSELRERLAEIETIKPIAVHCAAGYRSAIANSLLELNDQAEIYDISESIQYLRKYAVGQSR